MSVCPVCECVRFVYVHVIQPWVCVWEDRVELLKGHSNKEVVYIFNHLVFFYCVRCVESLYFRAFYSFIVLLFLLFLLYSTLCFTLNFKVFYK